MESSEVQRFLDEYPSLKYDKEKQKITCGLTKHEMPATLAAIESYVKGKKFRNAFKKDTYNYEQHKPHIISSNKKRHLHELFCTLTLRHIAMTPEAVERHVKGKRFKKALARWQSCQETGEKFLPRGGHRPSRKTTDNDSSNGGDDFWSNESGDDMANDDMSDLYPAADFDMSDCEPEANGNGDSGKYVSTKKPSSLPSSVAIEAKQVSAQDSDSDYDMGVLDETGASEKVTIKESVSQLPAASLSRNKRKKKKKQKETLPGGSGDVKKKKLSS